jgi:hypothetical protein
LSQLFTHHDEFTIELRPYRLKQGAGRVTHLFLNCRVSIEAADEVIE